MSLNTRLLTVLVAVNVSACSQHPNPFSASGTSDTSVRTVAVFGAAPAVGQTAQFTANADVAGSGQNVTMQAAWATSNAAIATVSPTGSVTGVAPGAVTIRATYQSVMGQLGIDIPSSPAPPATPAPGTLVGCGHVTDDASTLTRQLYWPSFNGTILAEVDVFLTSKDKTAGTYGAKLTVTANGTSATSQSSVVVSQPRESVATVFALSPKLSLPKGSSVRLKVEQTSGSGELFWEGQTDAGCEVLTVADDKSITQIVGPKIPVRIVGS